MFIVTDGTIRTPGDRSILQGVSRGTVFDLAAQLEVPCVEEDLQPYDIYTADEAFFATTTWSVMPVTQVDRRPIGDGSPGRVTRQLLAAWKRSLWGSTSSTRRFGSRVARGPADIVLFCLQVPPEGVEPGAGDRLLLQHRLYAPLGHVVWGML